MVVILVEMSVPVEDLAKLARLPSVDDLRPGSCPLCGQLARPGGVKLGIVGNGTYRRQVLGIFPKGELLEILVRRYICRGCKKSISVLPDTLLPWRWYAGTAMLFALMLSLLGGKTASEVRKRLGLAGETRGWKTLDRWQHQLLAPLWGWVATQIGFPGQGRGESRAGRCARLVRLAGLAGVDAGNGQQEIAQAAVGLAVGTAHTREGSWLIGHTG